MSASLHRGDQHPKPGTPEYDQLARELEFVLAGVSAGTMAELRRRAAAAILRFMVRRNCWPVGTRVVVRRNFTVDATFPAPRAEVDAC